VAHKVFTVICARPAVVYNQGLLGLAVFRRSGRTRFWRHECLGVHTYDLDDYDRWTIKSAFFAPDSQRKNNSKGEAFLTSHFLQRLSARIFLISCARPKSLLDFCAFQAETNVVMELVSLEAGHSHL